MAASRMLFPLSVFTVDTRSLVECVAVVTTLVWQWPTNDHRLKVIILLLFFKGLYMLTSMRQIGNSRGVLIPAAFLASCQIEDQVDIQLQDGQIVIKPVRRKLRDGWFDQSSAALNEVTAQEKIEALQWSDAALADDSEWVW